MVASREQKPEHSRPAKKYGTVAADEACAAALVEGVG
jgi:hypothetical protein